ncbi:hypothetical protein CRYUN_Cryun13aG0072200 [Craigia yunnanensis]
MGTTRTQNPPLLEDSEVLAGLKIYIFHAMVIHRVSNKASIPHHPKDERQDEQKQLVVDASVLSRLIGEACHRHGFVLVHPGVDATLLADAHNYDNFELLHSAKQLGDEFRRVYQDYCDAKSKLSLGIMEPLAFSP